jgi:tetratricopeptide (TPR) repeat protein
LAPWNADYWAATGLAAGQAGELELAIAALEQAVQHDRFRAARHWRLAQAELAAHGLTPRARAELRLAVELNRTHKLYRQTLDEAEEKLRQGGMGLLESVPTKAGPDQRLTD